MSKIAICLNSWSQCNWNSHAISSLTLFAKMNEADLEFKMFGEGN